MFFAMFKQCLAVLIGLTLTATGLWASGADEDESAAASDKEMVLDPSTGKMVTAPEYGGTLTWPTTVFPPSSDNWWNLGWAMHFISGVAEKMSHINWAVSRDIWDGTQSDRPEVAKGNLAESWSMPDDTTFIWNIRQGVHWHDKEPMNGRELDAHDIVWNYHRYLGMGDFTEDGPNAAVGAITWGLEFESVTATDKWTVEIKLAKPGYDVLGKMLRSYYYVHAPEQVEKYGDAKDWKTLVGTGPLMLVDFVEGSSATWEKNPNYWGYDEKFPDNRLPYIDTYRALLMPDMSTRLAALRTAKVDIMSNTGDAAIYSIDDLETLQRTNPEIEVWPLYRGPDGIFLFNHSVAPTDDVGVRKALQMAVDRETISATYFRGHGRPAPFGLMLQSQTGWAWPYEEWPDEVKREYEYRPADAEALLDEAGYPRGDDGVRFHVKLALHDRFEPTHPELIIGYFEAIGVTGELVMQTVAESGARNRAEMAEWELLSGGYGFPAGQDRIKSMCQNVDDFSYTKAQCTRLQELHEAAMDSIELDQVQSIIREADEITVREHFGLVKSISPRFSVNQPWVKSFSGESSMGLGERNTFFARLWIDSELKEASTGN